MPLGTKVGLDPSDIVIDGDPGPSPKRDTAPPHFLAHALWPNGSMNQDATWYGCRPRPRPRCVRLRITPPPKEKGSTAASQISTHVCRGQTAAWIKMAVGMEVDLSPGHIV